MNTTTILIIGAVAYFVLVKRTSAAARDQVDRRIDGAAGDAVAAGQQIGDWLQNFFADDAAGTPVADPPAPGWGSLPSSGWGVAGGLRL